jgi:hypothetical protein
LPGGDGAGWVEGIHRTCRFYEGGMRIRPGKEPGLKAPFS